MLTIDCRPAAAKNPGGTWLRRGAIAAGLILLAFCLVGVVGFTSEQSVPTSAAPPAEKQAVAKSRAVSPAPGSSHQAVTSQASDPGVKGDGGLDFLAMKTEAEEKLRGILTDDQGVRYRDVYTRLSTLDGGGIVAFCGEENSRTPLGGYGGFQRFIASRSVATLESQLEPAEFAQACSEFCENAVEGPQVWF